jgi:hypothetical protein
MTKCPQSRQRLRPSLAKEVIVRISSMKSGSVDDMSSVEVKQHVLSDQEGQVERFGRPYRKSVLSFPFFGAIRSLFLFNFGWSSVATLASP